MMYRFLIRAEWQRFAAHPVNRAIVLALALVLLASAVWSGLDARAYRANVAAQQQSWGTLHDQAVARAAVNPPANAAQAAKAVLAAHALGRGELGMTQLMPGAGLVLAVDRYAELPTAIRVTVESRYSDGRVFGPLSNPLLAQMGMPGFVVVLVLLLPLAALALTAGSVQEEKEQGTWRVVRAQSRVGVLPVWLVGLAIRWGVVLGVAALASACAFALDPGATWHVLARWLGAVALFCSFWILLGGLLSCLPVSAGAASIGALGLWLAFTFAIPAVLAWKAERAVPMPSRLAAITTLRAVQQDAEMRDRELLQAWYERHPQSRPADDLAPLQPNWPVTFMPRFEEQERRMRPVMRRFDRARAGQEQVLDRWDWMSPSLSMVLLAHRLAGIDAQRYVRYVDAVDRFEDRWRASITPSVMSYQGLTKAAVSDLPQFDFSDESLLRLPMNRPVRQACFLAQDC